jgi:hypothetical protein
MASFYSDKGRAFRRNMARQAHVGTNTVVATFQWGVTNAVVGPNDGAASATAAAADIIYMAPIPHRATVTRVSVVANRDIGTYKFGTSATTACFMANLSVSAGLTTCTLGIPQTISISDLSTVAYEWAMATVGTAGMTLNDQVQMILEYVIDN